MFRTIVAQQPRIHLFSLPTIECFGSEGGNANCGQEGYGGCSPGFQGDTAYTNDKFGTMQNWQELMSNNSGAGGYMLPAAQSWYSGYGQTGWPGYVDRNYTIVEGGNQN